MDRTPTRTVAMLRLAVLLECGRRDWQVGFYRPEGVFAKYGQSFLDNQARNLPPTAEHDDDCVVDAATEHGQPYLTVGQLRTITDGLDPSTHVVVEDQLAAWYTNVEKVGVPNEDGDPYQCLTMLLGDVYDARQH